MKTQASTPIGPSVRTRVLVREVMNSPVLVSKVDDDVRTIAEKMSSARVGSVVIVDHDAPVGIITDGDIVSKVVTKNAVASSVKAGDIMSTPLRTIESEKEIIEAARVMITVHVKRLGVTYKKNLAGIISISDILAVTPELFDIISEKRAIIASSEGTRDQSFLAGYCDQCNQWSDVLLEMDNRFLCEECRSGQSSGEDTQDIE